MPLYRIQHDTAYRHDAPASSAWQTLRLRPRDEAGQTTFEFFLDLAPDPRDLAERRDAFGNHLHIFSVRESHVEFRVSAHGIVRRDAPPPPPSETAVTLATAAAATDSDILAGEYALEQFRHPTEFVPLPPALREITSQLSPDLDLVAALAALGGIFRRDFTFDSTATEVGTPLAAVIQNRRGVCQDFAHLYLACARRLGLAAAYVSGYLRTEPPPGQDPLVGADAMHAWVSVHVPGHGWIDYDPTNHCFVGENHIVVARGRDYGDVSPIRGIFNGGGRHTLSLGVTVTPIEACLLG